MKRIFKRMPVCMFLMICLAAGMLFGLRGGNAEEAWPPAGKTEGDHRDGEIEIVFNHAGWGNSQYLLIFHDGKAQRATKGKMTQLAGEEAFGNVFSLEESPEGLSLNYNADEIQTEGEAAYRIDLENENYYTSMTLKAKFIDFESVKIRPKEEYFTCSVGETIREWEVGERMLEFEPAALTQTYSAFQALESNENYQITDEGFMALKEGEYTIRLDLTLGTNMVQKEDYLVTFRAVAGEPADAK